jgi:hypothetical protein
MAHRSLVIGALLAVAPFASATPALAQSPPVDAADVRITLPATLFTSTPPAVVVQPAAPVVTAPSHDAQTPSALSRSIVALCVSSAVLHALDVRSTYAVIERGGAEGNPVLAGVVPNKAAFIALKAGVAASTIFAASKIAKHHKVAGFVTLIALNSIYASVVAHNVSLAHQLR